MAKPVTCHKNINTSLCDNRGFLKIGFGAKRGTRIGLAKCTDFIENTSLRFIDMCILVQIGGSALNCVATRRAEGLQSNARAGLGFP